MLVADDHPVVRSHLCTMLSTCADIAVVCEAGDGTEAVAGWRAHRPDVGLIDLGMPGRGGCSRPGSSASETFALRSLVKHWLVRFAQQQQANAELANLRSLPITS